VHLPADSTAQPTRRIGLEERCKRLVKVLKVL